MRIDIKTKNLDLTPAISAYIEEKIGSLQKFLSGIEGGSTEVIARVEIARTTRHHAKGPIFRAEVNLDLTQNIARAEHEDWDIRIAIDKVKSKLQKEIVKMKEQMRPQDSNGNELIRKNLREK